MEKNRWYTVMPFPQGFDGTILKLNIVLIPRNMNPFDKIVTGLPAPMDLATAFADVQPTFEAAIVKGLDEFPIGNATATTRKPIPVAVVVDAAANKNAILNAIATDFNGRIKPAAGGTAEDALVTSDVGNSVKKYLPESYRNAFNFTSPKHPNAKTDDSYACVMRGDKKPVVTPPRMDVSWGELYAHILRQPLLAKACGMVYTTEITVEDDTWFEKGGYLFVNVLGEYEAIQNASLETADGPFIKRYAARIPKLKLGEKRSVFTPILFPVLHRKASDVVDPEPQNAPWDQIFPEVNEYNDGFAKIVHANQPVSNNLMQEQQDGLHPQHDLGVRMGWDDEQLLIWYIRQLTENPNEENSKKRIDAPLGVFGYCVDVKEDIGDDWESLNLVRCLHEYTIHDVAVGNSVNQQLELPFQVYPTQPDGTPGSAYWLPMYYGNWIGKSIVMKDTDGAAIYQNDKAVVSAKDNTPRNAGLSQLFEEVPTKAKLVYGNTYHFRVRMMDISGGTPDIKLKDTDLNLAPAPNATVHFRRYVAPGILRIDKPIEYDKNIVEYFNENPVTGDLDESPNIGIKRPILGYPAVVYTNKYQPLGLDPIQLLKEASVAATGKSTFGIADPDVTKIEVRVETETLKMDNQKSRTGKENYATLYITHRSFPAGFDDPKTIPVKFIDAPVLNVDDTTNPFNNPAYTKTQLDAMDEIVLPTARRIRVTVRAVCDGDSTYFGFTSDKDEDKHLDTRYGVESQLTFYKESKDESQLLFSKENVPPVQAIYLQPDPPLVNNGNPATFLIQRELNAIQPDVVQRLASQFGVEAKGLTLVSKKGQRIVFGCSNRIKHTLAPDHSSITFASKADLINHWIGVLTYKVNRDWTWDALEDVSFKIARYKKFLHDADAQAEDLNYQEFKNEYSYAGDIEIKHTVSFEALQPDNFGIINRDHTTLIFIDAIEPKTGVAKNAAGDLKFPDELIVDYGIIPQFKKNHGSEADKAMIKADELQLPTTVNPVQIPKLVSAGIAFSPYLKAGKYQSTEARRKYLWLEFEEPVHDPNDTLFCRMLAYSPDQLISNNHPELLIAPEESPLSIDPEFIRRITPGESDDMAGISAMQPMEKATDSDVHYLLPIPPGMHSESLELFGFFTYEFRIGHGHWSDRDYNLWSTAQARFGRPLRVTGMQHPAPTLLCAVNRNEEILWVNAPYAQAVFNGKNVTSKPPRTQLWCLLYTQVKQADGKAYRNILLDEKRMQAGTTFFNPTVEETHEFSLFRERITTDIKIVDIKKDPILSIDPSLLNAGAIKAIEKDEQPYALAVWENAEIIQILELLGLPTDGPLSVLVVEVFGNITSFREHLTDLEIPGIRSRISETFQAQGFSETHVNQLNEQADVSANVQQTMMMNTQDYSLSNNLGNFRILRTSPLTEVPFVCCVDCARS
jgi:hypothetical protein